MLKKIPFVAQFLCACVFVTPPVCMAQLSPVADSPDSRPILMVDPAGFASRSIRDIAISPDGQWLAVAGGKVVRIWNIRTGNLKATLRGELLQSVKMGRVNAVAFSGDNQYLIVGVSDSARVGSTRAYAMRDLSAVHGLIGGHSACTDRVVFSPDGKWLTSYG